MKKYIIIYHAPTSAMEQTAQTSPEEQAKGMEAWMHWAQKCGDKLVDMGAPLVMGQRLNPDGTAVSSQKEVCGYSIMQANNLEEAQALLQDHPHLGWNAACSIEIHESMPLPGM